MGTTKSSASNDSKRKLKRMSKGISYLADLRKDRKLRALAREYDLNYEYLYQISICQREASHDYIAKLKKVIDPELWYTYIDGQ